MVLTCPECGREFDNERSLRTHIGHHRRNEPGEEGASPEPPWRMELAAGCWVAFDPSHGLTAAPRGFLREVRALIGPEVYAEIQKDGNWARKIVAQILARKSLIAA